MDKATAIALLLKLNETPPPGEEPAKHAAVEVALLRELLRDSIRLAELVEERVENEDKAKARIRSVFRKS